MRIHFAWKWRFIELFLTRKNIYTEKLLWNFNFLAGVDARVEYLARKNERGTLHFMELIKIQGWKVLEGWKQNESGTNKSKIRKFHCNFLLLFDKNLHNFHFSADIFFVCSGFDLSYQLILQKREEEVKSFFTFQHILWSFKVHAWKEASRRELVELAATFRIETDLFELFFQPIWITRRSNHKASCFDIK